MRNTTIDTIEAHSTSRYCVLLCLCGGSIVSQHTAHLSVAALSRGLIDMSVQMLNSLLLTVGVCHRPTRQNFLLKIENTTECFNANCLIPHSNQNATSYRMVGDNTDHRQ